MNLIFKDQGTTAASNDIVSEFVRDGIGAIVHGPEVADKLMPYEYPIGSRRLVVDTGYYESFNGEHVTLVDVKLDPIERITPQGITTRDAEYEVDVIIFALGFNAFTVP